MITLRLPDMVEKVSSMVRNQSIKTSINNNLITISTDFWDFSFEFIPHLGYYNYESTTLTISDGTDTELTELKNEIIKSIFSRYAITNSL